MQVIGLGRGEQDAVDAPAEDRREPRVGAGAERGQDVGHRRAQVLDRARAVVDGAERVDQHHLPVEPGEVVAKERLDHDALVGVEALLERAPERRRRTARGARQRREGERGRALEVARHQEPPRRDAGEARAARRREVAGEGRRQRAGRRLVERRGGIGRVERGEPGGGVLGAAGRPGGGDGRRRPVGEALGHQRQVEQPFAGVVGDVEVHGLRARTARTAIRAASAAATGAGWRSSGCSRASAARGRAAPRGAPRRRSAARHGRAAVAGRPRGYGPRRRRCSWGMRPRSSRFATSAVMNTVLPARLRPVTPSRTTGSNSASLISWTESSIRRVRLSVRRARSKASGPGGGGSR